MVSPVGRPWHLCTEPDLGTYNDTYALRWYAALSVSVILWFKMLSLVRRQKNNDAYSLSVNNFSNFLSFVRPVDFVSDIFISSSQVDSRDISLICSLRPTQ